MSTGIFLCMCPANERWRYTVISQWLGHTQNDPCVHFHHKDMSQSYDCVIFVIAMSHEHHIHLITSHWTVCSTGVDPWHYWLFVRETTKDWWKCLVEDIEPLQLCPGNVWVVQKWHILFFYMRLHVLINGTKHSPINPSMSQVANVNIYGWHIRPCPIFVIDCRGWEPLSASTLQVAQYVLW